MNYRNAQQVAEQLRAAGLMLETVKRAQGGVQVGELTIESTRSVRCDVRGERKKQSGAYWLHELRLDDGIWITGAYWLDHGNSSQTIDLTKTCEGCGHEMPLKTTGGCPKCGSKKSKKHTLTHEQIEAHKKRLQEAQRQAEAEAHADAERAAAWANAVWLASREIFSPDEHDYLARKHLASAHGTRIFESNDGVMLEGAEKEDYEYLAKFHGALVVPMLDKDGRRRGLQFILSREHHKDWIARREGRDKEYWPRGMLKAGLHYIISGPMRGIGLLAEGFATAASLAEASALPVAVAFDANNLAPVGEFLWKSNRKRLKLLYAADDDWLQRCLSCKKITPVADATCKHCGQPHGKQNAGVLRAQEAALATSGAWLAPTFSTPRPDDRKGDTDFNDLRVREGEQTVSAQIKNKLDALEWHITPHPGAGGFRPGGAGESGREKKTDLPSIIQIDEAVQRFAMIYGAGGTWFDSVEHMLIPKADLQDILPEHGMRDMRNQKRVVRLDEVGFDPAESDPRIKCNLWGGWPTTPKQGSCSVMLELLEYLCSGESNPRETFKWVLNWLAYPIQHPGAKMRTALIFHGPQGAGKNLFFETVMQIYGEYGRIVDQSAIEDKFNDWASRKLFLIADEVVARAELYHVKNKLKGIVTGEWIRINPKNVAAHDERNHVNLVFLSNERQPLVLDKDDRRYAVIWTPEKLPEGFYADVKAELDEGGIAALHYHLLNLDLGDFNEHTKPPMTQAKADLIEESADSIDVFVDEWIAGEIEIKGEPLPFIPCLGTHLYTHYSAWARERGFNNIRNQKKLIGHLAKIPGWSAGKPVTTKKSFSDSTRVSRKMVIPSDDAMEKAAINRREPAFTPPPEGGKLAWITDCYFKFAQAIGAEA